MQSLLAPRAIAVIGASGTPGKVGYEIVRNLVDGGYEGAIVPVNPSAETICELKCYKHLADFPEQVDLVIIVVPRPAVVEMVQEAIHRGSKAIAIITAGFKEMDEEGAVLEKKIATMCKERNVLLLGPNCLGLINTHHRMNASFAAHMPKRGGISVISQSGALCTAILDWAVHRKLGLAKLVSMGNKAGLSENNFLDTLAGDDKTKVIVGYLENIESGAQFMEYAEIASGKKPIVVFKAGVTVAGSSAAASHTGSMAGTDMAYGAAFARSGVIRARDFEDMFDYAMGFAMQPLPRGPNVAIITNAGGPGIMAADAVEMAGMNVSHLDKTHAAALRSRLPKAASVAGPIDVLGDADPERYRLAVSEALADDGIDAVVVILTPQAMTKPVETARVIAECAGQGKPVLVSFMGGRDVGEARDELMAANIPDFPSPQRAVGALAAMWQYASWLGRPPRILTRFPVNRRRVHRILTSNRRAGKTQLGEAAAKEVLRAYQFKVPNGELATTGAEAVAAAQRVGFPVAMKIASPSIIHKSDMGGVKLNLANREAVEDAFDLMMLRIERRMPDAQVDGVYIEQMCARGKEVILGMTRDPQFGPMLMFGLGGVFVEVMKDVSFNIAPITGDEAMRMLRSTRSFQMLKGVRGQDEGDLHAIAKALQKISQLVTEFPEIVEMDINPFIVGSIGQESIAADARITLARDEVK